MRDVWWLLAAAALCFEMARRLKRRRQQEGTRVSPQWLNEHAYDRLERWRGVSK